MKDKTLTKMAILCSLAGVAALLIISLLARLPERRIEDLSQDDNTMKVRVKGEILSIDEREKVARITIQQPATIGAVVFKEKPGNMSFSKGDFLEITGEYRQIGNRKEIIADEVKVKEG